VVEQLGRLAEGVPGAERREVGVAHQGLGPELLGIHSIVGSRAACTSTRRRPEREEVLRPVGVAGLDPERLARLLGQARHRHLVDGEALEGAVLERGWLRSPALARLRSSKVSTLTMSVPPGSSLPISLRSAPGSWHEHVGASPGVVMS
jgi:hypothetical protein